MIFFKISKFPNFVQIFGKLLKIRQERNILQFFFNCHIKQNNMRNFLLKYKLNKIFFNRIFGEIIFKQNIFIKNVNKSFNISNKKIYKKKNFLLKNNQKILDFTKTNL